jgi:hypothetical protein
MMTFVAHGLNGRVVEFAERVATFTLDIKVPSDL